MDWYYLTLVAFAWMVSAGSPGPATLAISSVAMSNGRHAGLLIAAGVLSGSVFWGIASALGIGSLMVTNVWLFTVVKYLGALYLLYLALKSLRNAFKEDQQIQSVNWRDKLFLKGFLIHLTNPKAVLPWGSIYAIALPADAGYGAVFTLFMILISGSAIVFLGYGLLFGSQVVAAVYQRLRRVFDILFAALFGAASIKILTAKVDG